MVKRRSSASASTHSLNLRPKVLVLVRKMLRASCWVMVDPPCTQRPRCTLTVTARMIPIGSTPGCERKRLSSIAIIAFFIEAGIWSLLSQLPKLGPNETTTLLSAAWTRIIWPRSSRRTSLS